MLSMTGSWSAMQMQQVVRGYIAYDITGSFAALGGVSLANSIPRLLLALSGGVVADRASRRSVMQIGQTASMILTAIIGVLLFTDTLRFEHLIIAAFFQGAAMSFTMPSRQAILPDIVGPDRLTNAYGLNATGQNVMRLLAPAMAGILLALLGGAWVYALMTAMYGLAIVSMFRIPHSRASSGPAAEVPAGRHGQPRGRRDALGFRDMGETFKYLGRERVLATLLFVQLFVVLFTVPYQRLLPGFVAEVLADTDKQAAWRLGMLLTFTGLGGLIGSLMIASIPNRGRGRLLLGSIAAFAVALVVFAASHNFWFSLGVVVFLGVAQAGRQSLNQILIQTHVENQFRGRISSIMMMEMGLESLGTFAVALVAVVLGPQWAIASMGVGLLIIAAAVFVFAPSYRRVE